MDHQTREDVAAQVIDEIARKPRGAGEDSEGYAPPPRPRHRILQEQNKNVSLFVGIFTN